MENASKALIIAGAILLSILIISLGIMIFGQASEVVDSNAMSDLEITQFNTKFSQYTGPKRRGAQVNSLLNQVIQNNVTQDESRQVKVSINASSWSPAAGNDFKNKDRSAAKSPKTAADVGKALTGNMYTVEYETNPNTGLLDYIKVTDYSATSTATST